jgi:peptidoglycan/xylan/chitin deacetylase (PgdA/CDA1 family)
MLKTTRKIILYFFIFTFVCAVVFLKTITSFRPDPVILMYHSIGEAQTDKKNSLDISLKVFEQQMEFLHRYHYRVIPLLELKNLLKENKKIPSKTVVLTFDDGYENNYTKVLPILKKYDFPATIFVIVNNLGKEKIMYDRMYKFMTEDMMREMSDSGLITIGSHTIEHRYLPGVSDEDELWKEINGSKKALEKILRKPVGIFCYPVGGHTPAIEAIVRKSGYEMAVSIKFKKGDRRDDLYVLGRIKMTDNSRHPVALWVKFSGYYLRLKEL